MSPTRAQVTNVSNDTAKKMLPWQKTQRKAADDDAWESPAAGSTVIEE